MKLCKGVGEFIKKILASYDFWELLAMALFGFGIIVIPISIRNILLTEVLGKYQYVNIYAFAAIVILAVVKRNYSKYEKYLIVLWLFALMLALWSDATKKTYVSITAVVNCMLPIILLLYRFKKDNFKQLCKYVLCGYNIFIILLLCLAIYERITKGSFMRECYIFFDMTDTGLRGAMEVKTRFVSIWGHPLTNTLLFNIFFVLNDCYYRCHGKKYPKVFYFLIALSGTLLCASKTAIIVLVVYFVISSLQNVWVLGGSGIVAIIVYVLGGFDTIIERFQTTSLTTGRIDTLLSYLESGRYPLQFFKGYGVFTTYGKTMKEFKAAFEFPILMHTLDYGLLFAVILIGSIYIYMSFQFIKRKCYIPWFGYSLIYLEINAYNGICLYNQDIFILMCVFSLLMVNMLQFKDDDEREVEIDEQRTKEQLA